MNTPWSDTQHPVTPLKRSQTQDNICFEASGKHALLFWPGCHQPSSEGINVNSTVYPRELTMWSSKWTPVWRPYDFIQGLVMCLKPVGKHHRNEWSVKIVVLHTQTHILSYTHTRTNAHTCKYMNMHTHICTYTHEHTHKHTLVHAHMHIHTLSTHISTYLCMYIYTYTQM